MEALAITMLVAAGLGVALAIASLFRRPSRDGVTAIQWVALGLMLVGIVGFWIVFWVLYSA